MEMRIPQSKKKIPWISLLSLVGSVLLAALLFYIYLPLRRDLILFALYTIPSHMLISVFPHEPALLFMAKFYSPWTLSIVSTVACCIAGILDYWLLLPLVNHDAFRPKFENKRFFQKSLAFFKKSPFWFLSVAAFSPVPFYPFKFLSMAGNYPLWKYESALVVGRTPRYFTLAVLGYALKPPTWVLAILFVVLLAPAVLTKFSSWRSKRREGRKHSSDAICEAPGNAFPGYDQPIPLGKDAKRLSK